MKSKLFYLENMMSSHQNIKEHLKDVVGDNWLEKVMIESNIINERDFDTCVDYINGVFDGYMIGEFVKFQNKVGIIKDYKYIDNNTRVMYFYQNIQQAINMGLDISFDDYSDYLTKKYIIVSEGVEYELLESEFISISFINIIIDGNNKSIRMSNVDLTTLLKTLNKHNIPYKLF